MSNKKLKSTSFSITLNCQLSAYRDTKNLVVEIAVQSPQALDDDGNAERPFLSKLLIPGPFDQEGADIFAGYLFTMSQSLLPDALMLLSKHYFQLISGTLLMKAGDTITFRDLFDLFKKGVGKEMHELLNLPKRGHSTKWTKAELLPRVQSLVSQNPSISWEEINEDLKRTDPERAPKNGESLRQLARGMKILLRKVRRQGEPKRKVKKHSLSV